MGSGKTTLARNLSKKLNLPHYELDDIYWKGKERGKAKRSDEECKKLLQKLTRKKEWVIEGCFSRWIEPGIKNSQLVIWLDIPFTILIYRLFFRKLKGNNNEKWTDTLRMIKQSYEYSILKKSTKENWGHRTRKKQISFIKKHKIKYLHLKNTKEIRQFMGNLK